MKTIGILAHADAGKTTLSEQILFRTGARRTAGRVDEGSALLDADALERQRGISIYLGLVSFTHAGQAFTLLDTPGHADFSAETERAIAVMDAAVVVVSAVEGVQAQTEAVYHLLRESGVPILFFLNKTDRPGADAERVVRQLQTELRAPVCLYGQDEPCAEFLAGLDDTLLEQYLEQGGFEIEPTAARLFRENRFCPALCGAALQGEGVEELLGVLAAFVRAKEPEERTVTPFRIRHDAAGARLTFLRVTGGTLAAKELVCGEKINELRVYNGEKYQSVQAVEDGGVCAAVGLSLALPVSGRVQPVLTVTVETAADREQTRRALELLSDEDPLLAAHWREDLGKFQVQAMGTIQLEVLQQVLLTRFGIEASFGKGMPLYRETIAAPVVGYGHFEPLRHYAEVHLRLEPAPRGSGVTFESACPVDVLAKNWQNLVQHHIFEKQHRGVLTCSPLTDVRITLLTGRAHEKHTEGGDFREATWRAVRQGLEQAQNVLLEPYYAFEAVCAADYAGRVLGSLQRMGCEFTPADAEEGRFAARGRGPVAAFVDYAVDFAAETGGTGRLRLTFDGYEPVKNQEEVVAAIGYDRVRDTENTSTSIFCKKGAGYPVKWYDVPGCIHCK
ncbi:translation factor GTPase family protein [Agathobaculum sp.]|uniref:translation factor GTPase family protein n=1 Tax=Agathobaculum sp. TaxID=2048138 RepID=UPI002A83D1FA|nr:translation factor GTPase family protein [Agathobaculum sp.]MDY3619394.1 translation factor GTPase family protein [Agathobaculum sp.]